MAMTKLDQHHLQSWHMLRRGGDVAHTLDRFRQRHPAVFAQICQTDPEAASIAVQFGWPVGGEVQAERSTEEVDHARQTVAATLAAIAAAKIPHP